MNRIDREWAAYAGLVYVVFDPSNLRLLGESPILGGTCVALVGVGMSNLTTLLYDIAPDHFKFFVPLALAYGTVYKLLK